jgi:hypothetical protein
MKTLMKTLPQKEPACKRSPVIKILSAQQIDKMTEPQHRKSGRKINQNMAIHAMIQDGNTMVPHTNDVIPSLESSGL